MSSLISNYRKGNLRIADPNSARCGSVCARFRLLVSHGDDIHPGNCHCLESYSVCDSGSWEGCGDVIPKCDQREAPEHCVNALTKLRCAIPGVRTMVEHSVVNETQNNGSAEDTAEATVETAEGTVSTMKVTLEQRLVDGIELNHPIFYWLLEHAADVAAILGRL